MGMNKDFSNYEKNISFDLTLKKSLKKGNNKNDLRFQNNCQQRN